MGVTHLLASLSVIAGCQRLCKHADSLGLGDHMACSRLEDGIINLVDFIEGSEPEWPNEIFRSLALGSSECVVRRDKFAMLT